MKFLRDFLDKQKPLFEKGGKLEKFYYIYEAHDTLLFKPNEVAGSKGAHIRDAIDSKRMMMTVIIAMIPCLIFGIWNTGHQHFVATGSEADFIQKMLFGAYYVLPIVVVSYVTGLTVEFTFATIRRHEVNEGFLVSGMLIPLVMPATVPLWQVALGTIFAVIIAKEVFGGTGMNILNVALTARAFLYFAYPSQLSGDVWTVMADATAIDGYSGATALAVAYQTTVSDIGSVSEALAASGSFISSDFFSMQSMFLGTIPGSIGETSTLWALVGGLILVATGVGSWKIIVSVFGGAYAMGWIASMFAVNPYMAMDPAYHLVMGGLAFGAVFMATDPVTATQTELGKWIYGFLIGALTIIIRVFNPAYPEGIMLAILFMNVFAPLIDYYIVEANKKRRLQRATV
jgi:Na+-transporting NADH:ubiquinone oxidoreductase subunit B